MGLFHVGQNLDSIGVHNGINESRAVFTLKRLEKRAEHLGARPLIIELMNITTTAAESSVTISPETVITKATESPITLDLLFKTSKIELWSLVLFFILSFIASFLRLWRKHQNARDALSRRPVSCRPTDEIDRVGNNHEYVVSETGNEFDSHKYVVSETGDECNRSGDEERGDENKDVETGIGFRRTDGRVSWRW